MSFQYFNLWRGTQRTLGAKIVRQKIACVQRAVALRSVWGRKFYCSNLVQKFIESTIAQLSTEATLTPSRCQSQSGQEFACVSLCFLYVQNEGRLLSRKILSNRHQQPVLYVSANTKPFLFLRVLRFYKLSIGCELEFHFNRISLFRFCRHKATRFSNFFQSSQSCHDKQKLFKFFLTRVVF